MKTNKFLVKILNDDKTVKSEKEYKSFREIQADLNIDYHVIREINKITDGDIIKKFTHNTITELYEKLKIYKIKMKYNI
jgi:hypothetical protein